MKSVIAPVASDVNPFYDSAKRTNYRSFYGPQFPNVASKSAPLGIYNSDTGSVESLFKGELKLHMCILFLNSFDFALNLKKLVCSCFVMVTARKRVNNIKYSRIWI